MLLLPQLNLKILQPYWPLWLTLYLLLSLQRNERGTQECFRIHYETLEARDRLLQRIAEQEESTKQQW